MTSANAVPFVVAIDGPAGAGKSTVARGLATRLGYTFLDTGALYRSVALIAQRRRIPWDDTVHLGELARVLDVVFAKDGDGTRVVADGSDVTQDIRQAEISEGASRVSAVPEVRAGLLAIQRRVAARANVVAEGGTSARSSFPPRRRSSSLSPIPRRARDAEPWNWRPRGSPRSSRTCWPRCSRGMHATAAGRLPRCAARRMPSRSIHRS
jgi:gluconate kinase